MFVALRGEAMHGHQFVRTANERGAALFLIEDLQEVESLAGEGAPDLERCIIVDDSLQAFWTLATYWRSELAIPLMAITGSVGKTFTKDFCSTLLLAKSRGGFSQKSYNNHTGVPYTLSTLSRDHEWGVLEMGMNHAGELHDLVALVEPAVAVITRVAPVHLENLGTIEAVADAKCEIISGIRPGGVLVLNGDDAVLCEAAAKVIDHDKIRVKYFGHRDTADCWIKEVRPLAEKGLGISLRLDGEDIEIQVPVLGKHNADNIAAAVCAVRSLCPDLSTESIVTAAARFIPPPMRLNVRKLQGGKILIDDSYNANPLAMRALCTLAEDFTAAEKQVGYILGDMLELGPDAAEIHKEIAEMFAQSRPQFVIGVGDYASVYAGAAKQHGCMSFEAPGPEAAGHIASKIDFDVCMVKASRGVQLDKAVSVLIDTLGEVVAMPGMPEE